MRILTIVYAITISVNVIEKLYDFESYDSNNLYFPIIAISRVIKVRQWLHGPFPA